MFGFLMSSMTEPSIMNDSRHHLLCAFPIRFNKLDDEVIVENHNLEWHEITNPYSTKIDLEFQDCDRQPLFNIKEEFKNNDFIIDLKIREKK